MQFDIVIALISSVATLIAAGASIFQLLRVGYTHSPKKTSDLRNLIIFISATGSVLTIIIISVLFSFFIK